MPCDKQEKELGPNHVLKSCPGTGSFVYRSHDVNESVKYFEEHPNLKLGGANGRFVAGKQYLRDHGIQLRSWIHPICVGVHLKICPEMCLGPEHDLKLPPCVWVVRLCFSVTVCLGLPVSPPVRDASSTGSLSLCSSTLVIVTMEECAFASAAYKLRSSPRDVHGTEQRWKLSLTARTYRVSANGGSRSSLNLCMGAHTGGWLRRGAASRRCSWGSPGTRRP